MMAFNPPGVWPPFGSHSIALIQPEGKLIHLGGQVAWDENRQLVGKGDIRQQTRQTFRNIETILASVGGVMDDVLSIVTYLTDLKDLKIVHDVRTEFFADPYPVSTLVQAGLVDPDLLIEITATACVPHSRFKEPPPSRSAPPADSVGFKLD